MRTNDYHTVDGVKDLAEDGSGTDLLNLGNVHLQQIINPIEQILATLIDSSCSGHVL